MKRLVAGGLLAVALLIASPAPGTVTSNGDGSSTVHIKLGNSGADSLAAVNAICMYFNYQSTLPGGGANPETKAAFAERAVREQVLAWIKEGRSAAAAAAARATAEAQALPVVQ